MQVLNCDQSFTSALMFLQGAGSYQKSIKKVEEDISTITKKVDELTGMFPCISTHPNGAVKDCL